MAKESVFRGIIDFFGDIGIYDVVLPFLLVFTIVFAILEKTKILGTEDIDGKKYTKKNLNAIAALVMAFLVIASSRLVALINEAMGNIVILLLLAIGFLLLIGSFFREGEDVFLEKGPWRTLFMVLMFIGIALIFLHAVRTDDGESWLEWFWDYLEDHWETNFVASLIFIVLVVLFMWYIVREPKGGGGKSPPAAKKEGA